MTTPTLDLFHCVFAKTAEGQQEIQTRARKLPPLARRLLILIDGKRTGQELSAFMAGQDVVEMLTELLAQECISVVKTSSAPGRNPPVAGVGSALQSAPSTPFLQPPEARTPKELEMARNFMINTLNSEFGQHTCLTLIEALSSCSSAQELRQQYPSWHKTMSLSRSASQSLPGLVEKLMRVI